MLFEPRHDFFFAPHHRRRTFSQRDVSLNEETSVNRNLITSSKNLFVNFGWTFTSCVEKNYGGMLVAFGGTLDRRCHFKNVSIIQSRFYHYQTSTAHR